MKNRWAPGFTIVELVIVITVLAILAAISTVGYSTVRKSATIRVAQSDLDRVSTSMEHARVKSGSYPTSLPADTQASKNITLTVAKSGVSPYYTGLSAVQNGVLLAQICQNLLDEGAGKGVDQGGTTQDYISSCGNWNHDSMQFTAWDTKKWNTPVSSEQLLNYADSYVAPTQYHKVAQEGVVKNFYRQLVSRQLQQGGTFPITTFWDYWANSGNGGVLFQPLSSNPQTRPYYCVEAQANDDQDILWHVSEGLKIQAGAC